MRLYSLRSSLRIHASIGSNLLLLLSKLGQPLLQIIRRLRLDLLLLVSLTRQRVSSRDLSVLLRLLEVLKDAVAVLVEHFLGDTLHAKNLHLETLSVGKRVFDLREVFLVDLVHVHGETCNR